MRQRCVNPEDKGYKNYGARGIEFRFASPLEGGLWVMENLGLHKHLELDRMNNNGHYEAGNLRYGTRSVQNRNQRRSKMTLEMEEWAQTKSPYAYHTTHRLLCKGFSRRQIIAKAKQAVRDERKCWRKIQKRLASLGYTTS